MAAKMQHNISLDPWQKEVKETKGNLCLRSGRQVGKSTVISELAADEAAQNPGKIIMIIASVERQAYLLFEKVMFYMEDKYKALIKKKKDRPTKTRLKLINGSIIYCLPAGLTGAGIRGYTIDLLIADEAAFIPDAVFSALTPSISTRVSVGARIVLLSTPFGREGYFARAFNDDTFTKFHVSSEDCERIDKTFLEQERTRMTKRQYAQEYLGEFVDELMQFFPDRLIQACMKRKREGTWQNRSYYLGVDLARMGEDESTFEVVELLNDGRLMHVESQVTTRTYLWQSTQHILYMDKAYNFKKIYIDDEGIGVGVYDHLLNESQTKRKVIPINNSKRVVDMTGKKTTRLLKEDLYNNLLALMEKGKIELLDDPEIFHSLKSVQYEYSKDTLGRNNLHIFGNYTHIAEGLIRAAWCVSGKHLKLWLTSFKV